MKSDTILNSWRYLVEDYDVSINFYKKHMEYLPISLW